MREREGEWETRSPALRGDRSPAYSGINSATQFRALLADRSPAYSGIKPAETRNAVTKFREAESGKLKWGNEESRLEMIKSFIKIVSNIFIFITV